MVAADACEAAGLEVELAWCPGRAASPVGEFNSVANRSTADSTTRRSAPSPPRPTPDRRAAIVLGPDRPRRRGGDAIVAAAKDHPTKPVLACVLGRHVIIERHGHAVPSFDFPESAALALARVATYADWRRRPEGAPRVFADMDREGARLLVDAALGLAAAGSVLDLTSATRLLGYYGIAAREDAGAGLVIEVMLDPLFGHLVAIGTDGPRPERSFRSLPLTDLDAADLAGGRPGLEELLLRLSSLVEDLPEVAALHVGVILATPPVLTVAPAAVQLAPWRLRPERAVRRLR